MIDDRVELVPPQDVDLRPERDAEFVELLRAVPTDASVRIASADTSLGTLGTARTLVASDEAPVRIAAHVSPVGQDGRP